LDVTKLNGSGRDKEHGYRVEILVSNDAGTSERCRLHVHIGKLQTIEGTSRRIQERQTLRVYKDVLVKRSRPRLE